MNVPLFYCFSNEVKTRELMNEKVTKWKYWSKSSQIKFQFRLNVFGPDVIESNSSLFQLWMMGQNGKYFLLLQLKLYRRRGFLLLLFESQRRHEFNLINLAVFSDSSWMFNSVFYTKQLDYTMGKYKSLNRNVRSSQTLSNVILQ